MFFVIKKGHIFLGLLLIIVIGVALSFSVSGGDKTENACRKYVISLGYHPSFSAELTEITVPEGFGKVYEEYNALQKEAGFDLMSFRGLTLRKYTFSLSDEENLFANILVYNNKICGGDICNPSFTGYMLPLKEKENAS